MKNSNPTCFRFGAATLAFMLLALFQGCAGQNGSVKAGADQSQAHSRGADSGDQARQGTDAKGTALDRLATDLSQYREVFRIGESIILPLRDDEVFQPDDSIKISSDGATLLNRIGATLREHPDTRIYIQEYVPAGEVPIQTRRQAMDQAYILRNEFIGRNIEPIRLMVDIEPRKPRQARPTSNEQPQQISLQHRFDLHIIPLE